MHSLGTDGEHAAFEQNHLLPHEYVSKLHLHIPGPVPSMAWRTDLQRTLYVWERLSVFCKCSLNLGWDIFVNQPDQPPQKSRCPSTVFQLSPDFVSSFPCRKIQDGVGMIVRAAEALGLAHAQVKRWGEVRHWDSSGPQKLSFHVISRQFFTSNWPKTDM